jgi:acyl carrier protein
MLFEMAQDKAIGVLFHAGGVLADATLQQQNLKGLRGVMAAKQKSLALLLPHLQHMPMQSSVLFSSVASLLGAPGQSNYAAANAGLDGAAGVLSAAGLGVVSCQWGAWAGAGMAAQDASTAARVARSGMELLQPQQGLAVLEQLLQSSAIKGRAAAPVVSAVPFIWSTFVQRQKKQHKGDVPALFSDFEVEGAAHAETKQRAVVTPGQQKQLIHISVPETVSQAVREVLGAHVSPDEPLMAAGLDSLGAVELRNALEGALGLSLPGTLVFDYPTLSAMTTYLSSKLVDSHQHARFKDADDLVSESVSTASGEQSLSPINAVSDRYLDVKSGLCVGVVAMSAQLPQSCDLGNLEAIDTVTPVPYSRWDVDWASRSVGEQQVSFGSFLQEVAAFDAAAFGLSEAEAMVMDPQQRLLLHHSLEVLTSTPAMQLKLGTASGADGAPAAANKAGCGVFVGVSSRDYYTIAQKGNQVSA